MKICAECFSDLEIKGYILSVSRESGVCPYCSRTSTLVDMLELEDFYKQFFSVFKKAVCPGIPLIDLIQQDWQMFSTDTDGNRLLLDLLNFVDMSGWTPDTLVAYNDEIEDCVSYWKSLKDELKWKRRYLTNQELFDNLGWINCFDNYSLFDSSLNLYRARINKNGTLTPFSANEMGCPPCEYSSGGRANPNGIPYLYLSKDLETTLYETRAAYLDLVSIGTFNVLSGRRLKIVDFTDIQSPLNYVDDMINKTKGKLLRKVISRDLSKPMRRFDSELEYIPTQFICEFIRYFCNADGIQFSSSVHRNGTNIVLFNQNDVVCVDVCVHQVDHIHIESNSV